MQDGNVGWRRGEKTRAPVPPFSRAYTRVERYFILPESGMCNI